MNFCRQSGSLRTVGCAASTSKSLGENSLACRYGPAVATFAAGLFCRHQSHIARNPLGTSKSLRGLDYQDERERSQRTDARMRHEPFHFRPPGRFLFSGCG